MKNKITLSNQLTLISLIVFIILIISITVFIPKTLSPYLDEIVYNFLNQPLKYFNNNLSETYFTDNIAYIEINNDNNIIVSSNSLKILKTNDYNNILNKINSKKGTFNISNKKYYYVRNMDNNLNSIKITITDDNFINQIKSKLFISLLPVIIITFLLILIALLIWCNFVVRKIGFLVRRVNNINSDTYDIIPKIKLDDELKVLENSIDNTRIMLRKQEDFKNMMYQNISHDFKTPIAVIKSYIEANRDGIINSEEANKVIDEQINKLDNKVKSLLQLNKIEYLKEDYKNNNTYIDINNVVDDCVNKFRLENKNIKWTITTKKKNIMYKGSYDMWESILDNLLTNFMRYAKNNISIDISHKKLVLFNDGESIDESIINDIFSPYKKGMKGQFGLGLSIVRKTCELLGFNIHVNNVRGGVKFIIEKNNNK